MKKFLSLGLALTLCLGLLPAAYAANPVKTSNKNRQTYTTWASPVKSYLYENPTGGLTRVEYFSESKQEHIIVEDYDSSFQPLSSRTLPIELPLWGGFYAGEDYNFVVFGQKNEEQNNDKEVIRVVKYSKDWQRLGQASLNGLRTTVPFDAGSLRMAEYGGYLYLRTCHEMYRSNDGLNHQANMMFNIREADMAVTDSFYGVQSGVGYVSHSFNQFILIDQQQRIVTLDQGDVYPRGLQLNRYYTKAGQDKFLGGFIDGAESATFLTFPKSDGHYNNTGAAVGGLGETANGYVTAYQFDGVASSKGTAPRTVYLAFTDKNDLSKTTIHQLSGGGNTSNPVLAPTGPDGGYVLWNPCERLSDILINRTNTLCYVHYGPDGQPGELKTTQGALSDCQPIVYNGKVVWYSSYLYQEAPVFYTLDESGVKAFLTTTAYANTQTVQLNGKPVTFQTYALKDDNGNLTNYVKLRDLAYRLNGTKAQFSVKWEQYVPPTSTLKTNMITLTPGQRYTPNGTELSTPFSGNRPYQRGDGFTIVNDRYYTNYDTEYGDKIETIILTDDKGGDYTYYKLRDLGRALNFNVSYINGQVVINTNQPYSDAQ